MPECLTCTCGGQTWTIFGGVFECTKCGKKVSILECMNTSLRADRDPVEINPPACLNDPIGHKAGMDPHYCWDTDLPRDEWCEACLTHKKED